jgi:hypothetical protein
MHATPPSVFCGVSGVPFLVVVSFLALLTTPPFLPFPSSLPAQQTHSPQKNNMAESASLAEIKRFTSASAHFLYLPTKSTSHDPSPQEALKPCIKPGKEAMVQALLTKFASTRSQLSTTIATINEAPFDRSIFTAAHQVDIAAVEKELRSYLSIVKGFTTDKAADAGASSAATTDTDAKDVQPQVDEGNTAEPASTTDVSLCCAPDNVSSLSLWVRGNKKRADMCGSVRRNLFTCVIPPPPPSPPSRIKMMKLPKLTSPIACLTC